MMFLRLEPLQDRTWWQRCMERPLKQREERGLKRLQVLMGCIALRRTKLTKVNGQPLVSLPDKRVMQVR
jgi:SWI/SNF-related matrix-associated actin-dependent regulator of chromatin subfamily A3